MSNINVLRDPRNPKTLEALYRISQAGGSGSYQKVYFGGTAPITVYLGGAGWVLVANNDQNAYPGALPDDVPVILGGNSILPERIFGNIPDLRQLRICDPGRTQLSITTTFSGSYDKYTGAFSRFTRGYTMAAYSTESDLWSIDAIAPGATKTISKSTNAAKPLKHAIYGGNPIGIGNELNWRPLDGTSQIFKGKNTRLQLWMRWMP